MQDIAIANTRPAAARQLPQRITLSTQLILMAAGLVGLTALVIGYVLYQISSRQLLSYELESLSHGIDIAENRLLVRFDTARRTVLAASKTPPIRALMLARHGRALEGLEGTSEAMWTQSLETIFAGFLQANPEYASIRYIGLADGGRELVRVNRAGEEFKAVRGAELQRMGDRLFFLDTLELGSGEIHFSKFELDRERDVIQVPHVPTVRATTPVFTDTGERFGIVVINIDLSTWFDVVVDSVPESAAAYLADRQADYLVHRDKSKVFGFDLDRRYRLTDDFPATKVLFATKGQPAFAAVGPHETLVAGRVSFIPGNSSRFLVLAAVSSNEIVLTAARTMRAWTIVVTVVMIVAAMAISTFLARMLSRPIRKVTAAARSIADGRLDTNIAVHQSGSREVFDLASAFNRMADRLEATLVSRDQLAAKEEHLRKTTEQLRHKAAELEANNKELEAFSYSVSHDLRAPLRSIDGFSHALEEDYGDRIDDAARDMIRRVREAASKMGFLIDGLLKLSRVTRAPLQIMRVDLSKMAEEAIAELRRQDPMRRIVVEIEPDLAADCDRQLIAVALFNLLENAWKYTSKQAEARIAFGRVAHSQPVKFFVRDNGAGFDAKYSDRIFEPFQRLHSHDAYPGTGIGLATVSRIIARHGGSIGVESEVGKGTTFTFTV